MNARTAAVATALAYFVACRWTVAVTDPVASGAGYWPAAGVAVAALVLCPRRWWPAILAGIAGAELANDLLSGYGLGASAIWAVANAAEALLAASLVARLRSGAMATVRDVARFVLGAAVVAPLVGGALGAVGTVLHGSAFGYLEIVVRWAVGDGLGILTVVPAVLAMRRVRRVAHDAEALFTAVIVAAACVFVLFAAPWEFARPYLTVPPLLWAATRYRVGGAAAAACLTALLASVAISTGQVEVASVLGGSFGLHVYLATMTVTMLVVGARTEESLGHQHAAASEQRRADLEDALARLARAALESSDSDELGQRVSAVLEPVVGTAVAMTLTDGDDVAHERMSGTFGEPAEERLIRSFVAEAAVVIRSAQRRIDAEQELRRSQALLRVAGEVARIGGWAIDLTDDSVTWSEEVHRILRWRGRAAPALAIGLERYLPAHRAAVSDALRACATHGTSFDLEAEILPFSGDPMWVRVVAEAQRGADGTVIGVHGALQDVTALHHASARADALGEQHRVTLESITDAFYTVDTDWCFTYLNERATATLQRELSSLIGCSLWDEFPTIVGTVVEEAYRHALRTGVTAVIEDFFYAPLDVWVDIRAYPSPQGLAIYFQDVTERHAARGVLREREIRLAEQAALLDEASDAIVVSDLDHRITFWNRGAERLYGWQPEEAVGRSITDLLSGDSSSFDRASIDVLASGEWQGELQQVRRTGEELLVEGRWSLVRDDDGRPRSILAINTDITERRELEEQVLRAQRIDSIGTLAGGLAHDLNNVLAAVAIATDVLRADPDGVMQTEMLDIIDSSSHRAADMLKQILLFARGSEGRRGTVGVDDLLAEVGRIIHDTTFKAVRIVRDDPSGGPWSVVGDRTQLLQVLMNVYLNARDAMAGGGTLRVSVDALVLDQTSASRIAGAEEGSYVRISVEDDGIGMPPETVQRIFEPFFTTKELGSGTGLGLSTAAGIVRSHGGFITVVSESGVGTVVAVHLPAGAVAPTASVPARGRHVPDATGEAVLLVEDEELVRTSVRHVLQTCGYRVIEATDGDAALAALERHDDDVRVIVTDLMMPGLDGTALLEGFRSRRPWVPIVATSGMRSAVDLGPGGLADRFLAKPFTAEELVWTLHDLLDRPGPVLDRRSGGRTARSGPGDNEPTTLPRTP